MKTDIIIPHGTPLDGLVRLEDRGLDRRGRHLLWLYVATVAGGGRRWHPAAEKYLAWPESAIGSDQDPLPRWSIPVEHLVGDYRNCDGSFPTPPKASERSSGVTLVLYERGKPQREPIQTAEELRSPHIGVHILIARNARGRVGDGGVKNFHKQDRRPRVPEIEIDIAKLATMGQLRSSDGSVWMK